MTQRKAGFSLLQELPPPKKGEEAEALFLEYHLCEDGVRKDELFTDLVSSNLRLVVFLVRRIFPNDNKICNDWRITFDELFSEGYYGLMKAVRTFDPSKKIKFATYATTVIRNELLMMRRRNKRSNMITSADSVIHMDGNGNEMTLYDILEDPYNGIDEYMEIETSRAVRKAVYRQLTPKHLQVLRMCLFMDMTQKDTAEALGISQSYVSRLLDKAMDAARKVYEKETRAELRNWRLGGKKDA